MEALIDIGGGEGWASRAVEKAAVVGVDTRLL